MWLQEINGRVRRSFRTFSDIFDGWDEVAGRRQWHGRRSQCRSPACVIPAQVGDPNQLAVCESRIGLAPSLRWGDNMGIRERHPQRAPAISPTNLFSPTRSPVISALRLSIIASRSSVAISTRSSTAGWT